jgi:hypothetical protein
LPIGHVAAVGPDTERALVAAIDDVLAERGTGGMMPRSEFVDALLDLRLTLTWVAALDRLDPDPTPRTDDSRTPRRHWRRERQGYP